jgi:hypothetical protein
VEAFRNFVAEQNSELAIPYQFDQFLEYYVSSEDWCEPFQKFRDIYNTVLTIQPHFSHFYRAYDRSIEQNFATVHGAGSQKIRQVLSQVSEIDSSCAVQEDAAEVMTPILDILPNKEKIHIEEATHYEISNAAAIANAPDGIVRRDSYTPMFLLSMDPEEKRPSLEQMFERFCHERINLVDPKDWVEQQNVRGERQRYRPLERHVRILGAPLVLRFQVKRTVSVPPEQGWLARLLSDLFGFGGAQWKSVKLKQAIHVPEMFLQNYALFSFVVHEGETPKLGHYKTYVRINNQPCCCDDQKIVRVSEDVWQQERANAYIWSYSLVN